VSLTKQIIAFFVAVLFVVGARPAMASSEPEPSIVVLPLRIDGELPEARRQELETALRRGLERAELELVDAAATDCNTIVCATEVARAAKADYAVLPRIAITRRDYDLVIEVIDARQGKVVASSAEHCEVCGIAEVIELVDTRAAALSARLQALRLGAPVLVFESTPPGALIHIDGDVVGETPLQRVVEAGAHRVGAELSGYVPETREIDAVPGVHSTIDFELTPIPRSVRFRRLRIFGWTAIGVGAAAVLVGGPLIAVHGRENEVVCSGANVDPRGNCKYLHATRGPGIAVTVVGAALLATGIGILIGTRDKRKSPGRARANLGVGPGSIAVSGRF
jgi:hypothetical protein